MSPHIGNKRFNSVDGSRDDEPAIVEPETYPQIVHEHRESDHHGSDAPWSAELPPDKANVSCVGSWTNKRNESPGVRIEEFIGLASFAGDIGL